MSTTSKEKTKTRKAAPIEELRIHVYLSRMGYGSRRGLEEMIEEGKVSVNGKPAKLGQKINPGSDEVRVRRKLVSKSKNTKSVVYLLNKPKGCVTTVSDPLGRPTVMDFLPKKTTRLFPVGRLDLNSEGLLVMTNDGELAQRLTHPQFEISKVYEVKIRGKLTDKKREYLEKGVKSGNQKFAPAEILGVRDVTVKGVPKHLVRIRVHEGKNHHVKKLFEAVSCRVVSLRRVSMGSMTVKGIARGEFSILPDSRVQKLKIELGLKVA